MNKEVLVGICGVGAFIIYFMFFWESPIKKVLKHEDYVEACQEYAELKRNEWAQDDIALVVQCYPAKDGWVRAYNPINGEIFKEISWKEWQLRVCEDFYKRSCG